MLDVIVSDFYRIPLLYIWFDFEIQICNTILKIILASKREKWKSLLQSCLNTCAV